jgi:hypothetical protein
VTESLTAAYVAEPRDGELALLLGHAHLWKLAERSREPALAAAITDHAVLATHYFDQAETMKPDDTRIKGWLGGSQLALASINDDERMRRRGYFTLRAGAEAYPEFNEFSFGYAMSVLPKSHERWSEVVDAMWKSVDVCAGEKVSRQSPDYAPFNSEAAEHADLAGPRRACWNSEIAPHNFEGFFLHNGDVLVKNAQPEVAVKMYQNAKLSRSYAEWPYRDVLEQRIASVKARAERFELDGSGEMMVASAQTCTGCHQR